MMTKTKFNCRTQLCVNLLVCLFLVRCAGNIGSFNSASNSTSNSGPFYSLGGTLSGLTGTVILQNNNSDPLILTSNASFTFASSISAGSTYSVTIKTQPAAFTCFVSNASGTASTNVTNVSVSCVAGKRIYVTNSTFTGNFLAGAANPIIGADANCMADSNKPSDLTTAKALITDESHRRACTTPNCTTGGSTEQRDWVLVATRQYLRLDGTVIGSTDSNGIFNSGTPLNQSISTAHTAVWTGFNTSALEWETHPSGYCVSTGGWEVGDSTQNGTYGYADATNYSSGTGAFNNGTQNCNNTFALYCVEQ